ncbi:MAG: outer membrane lipoprotein-sorting protein [Spirochaetia bacterium]|nr:outer membrane lipoprotein-sorting protein [Spirochaetia bacterium]
MNKKYVLVMALLLAVSLPAFSVTLEQGTQILSEIDEIANFEGTDFSALMTMIAEDPDSGIEKTKVQQFRDDAEEKFLLLIQEPQVKKGQGYLLIEDNLWFYDPESRKFSHTSMKDQFNGSDANNSDFNASSVAENYRVTSIEEDMLGRYEVYVLEIEALNNEVTYPTQKLWVTRKGSLTLKSEDYSAGGRLMRTSYYPSYAKAGDNYIPTKMIFNDELIEGKKTTITITDISTKDIPESIFTKSYVERVNN